MEMKLYQENGKGVIHLNEINIVAERNGKPITTSRKIAKIFKKEHYNVLRDIENLDCSKEFNDLNFELVNYKDKKGEKRPEYIITKDGFTFLVMGYKGKKASGFKEAYIKKFNEMENFIKSLQEAKMDYPELTRAIQQSHENPKPYHYSNEINMINRIVLGMDAKHFKEQRGINKKENSIRPYLTAEQIKAIEELQRIDIGLVVASIEFEKRKELLQSHYNKRILSCS